MCCLNTFSTAASRALVSFFLATLQHARMPPKKPETMHIPQAPTVTISAVAEPIAWKSDVNRDKNNVLDIEKNTL